MFCVTHLTPHPHPLTSSEIMTYYHRQHSNALHQPERSVWNSVLSRSFLCPYFVVNGSDSEKNRTSAPQMCASWWYFGNELEQMTSPIFDEGPGWVSKFVVQTWGDFAPSKEQRSFWSVQPFLYTLGEPPPAVLPQIPAGTAPNQHRRHRKQQQQNTSCVAFIPGDMLKFRIFFRLNRSPTRDKHLVTSHSLQSNKIFPGNDLYFDGWPDQGHRQRIIRPRVILSRMLFCGNRVTSLSPVWSL